MERLGVTQGGAHSLNAGAGDVIEGVLLGERPARGLAVGTQGEGFGVLGVELVDNLGPEHTGGTHLGNLHEVVHAYAPEEAQAGSKVVDTHTGIDTSTEILQAVGQRVGQLDVGGGAGFLHVVTGDGDAIELGHVLRGVLEDVGNNLHGRQRGVDVGVAHHELLQDVVLDGALQLFLGNALLLGGNDIESQNGQHGAVHGHGDGHLAQVDLVEENLHVEDAVDSHTGLADVTHHTLVVAVVATVSGQVESAAQALLTGGDIAAIEGVRLLGGGETGILTDGPRTHHIHGAVGATEERSDACCIVEVLHPGQVILAINGLHINLLGSLPTLLDIILFLPFDKGFFVFLCPTKVYI